MYQLKNRKGAMELSIGTIVILVIGMAMLILGLVLVRTIFTGAQYNVNALNKNVEAEINKLFNEKGGRVFVYLPNNQADVKKGQSYGVAFAVKNDVEGETAPGKFTYQVVATSVQKGCALTLEQANSYVILSGEGAFELSPGADPAFKLVKVQPSTSAPLCEISYDINVKKDTATYASTFFVLKITG
jgi:hypothetical protein